MNAENAGVPQNIRRRDAMGTMGEPPGNLTRSGPESQTECMAHIYLTFDFASDEEKAQQARHKLDSWKQAFRLDKKLLYKFDRGNGASAAPPEEGAKKEKAPRGTKSKAAPKQKEPESVPASQTKLYLRLGFSNHEKLTEQRWVERIPAEEPFKSAAPVTIRQGQSAFEEVESRFEELD